MSAKEKATQLHEGGFNCAQSVLCALENETGLDRAASLAVAGGFGGGVRCGEICGAACGAVMAIGLAKPFTDPRDDEAKNTIATLTKQFTRCFRESFGCIRCLDLKASGHSCAELIEYSAELAEKIITEIE